LTPRRLFSLPRRKIDPFAACFAAAALGALSDFGA
jgi:hypothetical protein